MSAPAPSPNAPAPVSPAAFGALGDGGAGRWNEDGGSAGVSTMVAVLAFFAFIGLGVGGMRLFTGAGDLQAAAQSAARAAALEHDFGEATAKATQVAQDEIAQAGHACENMIINFTGTVFEPGGRLQVNLTCTVSFQGLYLPGASGSRTVEVTAVEPIDCLRGGGAAELDDNCYYGG